MAETAGGLVKSSFQVRRNQMAWLQARADARGQASKSSALREVIDLVMNAQQAPARAEGGVR